MKTSLLEYYKQILDKVSFDHKLFIKEYNKALNILKPEDIEALDRWLQAEGLYIHVKGTKHKHSYASSDEAMI